MTFILFKTLDGSDFISNSTNIVTIEPRETAVDLRVQHPAKTTSIWSNKGLQDVFSILVERGTAAQRAIELAQEISTAEKSGTLVDLRDRVVTDAFVSAPVRLGPGFFR